jgi:hypothetical protein
MFERSSGDEHVSESGTMASIAMYQRGRPLNDVAL